MNKLYIYLNILLSLFFALAWTGCNNNNEIGGSETLSIKVFTPTKVLPRQKIIITGTGLDRVEAVVFPGQVRVTDINVVSANMISVITPATINKNGGELIVEANGSSVAARVPITIGNPVVIALSPSDKITAGNELQIVGNDMEFFTRAIFSGKDGNVVINAIDFSRKSTSQVRIVVPDKMKEGTYSIYLETAGDLQVKTPDIFVIGKPLGEWIMKEETVWSGENFIQWGNGLNLKVVWFTGIQNGDVLNFYFHKVDTGDHMFKFNTGEWSSLSIPELANGDGQVVDLAIKGDITKFSFMMYETLLNPWFTKGDSWGNGDAMVINGTGICFDKVTWSHKVWVDYNK